MKYEEEKALKYKNLLFRDGTVKETYIKLFQYIWKDVAFSFKTSGKPRDSFQDAKKWLILIGVVNGPFKNTSVAKFLWNFSGLAVSIFARLSAPRVSSF